MRHITAISKRKARPAFGDSLLVLERQVSIVLQLFAGLAQAFSAVLIPVTVLQEISDLWTKADTHN